MKHRFDRHLVRLLGKLDKLSTYFRLGPSNLWRVAAYRTALRYNCHPVQRVQGAPIAGPFFEHNTTAAAPGPGSPDWHDRGVAFGFHHFPIDDHPPNWFLNRLNNQICQTTDRPWWELADFDPQLGDIKGVWELSRFDWVLAFVQQVAYENSKQNVVEMECQGVSGKAPAAGNEGMFSPPMPAASGLPRTEPMTSPVPFTQRDDNRVFGSIGLVRLNDWLRDWCDKNPCYLGPNWKCGQEASIRVLHLILAAEWLGQLKNPTSALINLITNHLKRISPTLSYAVGQCNNHATSEAAALYVGGGWLASLEVRGGCAWQKQGRYWLENRARVLIETDGTFSQYSVNYHRLMLDAYSLAERFRRSLNDRPFSKQLIGKLSAAVDWLARIVQPETGDVPKLGANDGANLLPLTSADYRDYRPATELAARLWQQVSLFPNCELADEHCRWLNVPIPTDLATIRKSEVTAQAASGFATMNYADWLVVLRYPHFRFRPSQADLMHVDVWHRGKNLLRDAGSYSYNCSAEIEREFISAGGHNTIEFDDRDAMPRLSRFLWGSWPSAIPRHPFWDYDGDQRQLTVAYQDYQGAFHQRRLTVSSDSLIVKDSISGFQKKGVLRWRLQPGVYNLVLDESGHKLQCAAPWGKITFESSVAISRAELVSGWESRYYAEKSPISILEVEIRQPSELITTFWPAE